MTDQDTLELRRIVADDPGHPSGPDLPALIRAGRRVRTRRRLVGGGVAAGVAAVVAVPLLALGGGPGSESAVDPAPAASTSVTPTPVVYDAECGVLSCVHPPSARVETGSLIDELPIGTLPGGAEEVLYVARTADARVGRTIEALTAGYHLDGRLWRTAAALEPRTTDPREPRFLASPGPANGRPGDSDHYAVLGYVDGSPDTITWSTPDGESGEVDGLLRLDGYTAFYLARPLPADYVPPPRATRNTDGSITIETDQGPRTVRSGETFPRELLMEEELAPDLTIHTSDGWSCAFADCGRVG